MAVVLNIDGTDRSSQVKFDSLKRRNRINDLSDELSFSLIKSPSKTYVPSVNEEVVLTIGGTKEFGGVIVRIKSSVMGKDLMKYDVKCKDYSQYLGRQLVTENYTSTTIDAIISDLVSNYTSGFTTTNVDANVDVESISFNRLTVTQCIEKLSRRSGYSWYVDYDKDIHFFSKSTELAPFSLSDTAGNHVYKSLAFEDDISQLRNTILVQGGEKLGASRTITRDGADVSTEGVLDLQYKFSSKPTVEVNSVAQTVGLDFIDDDASYDVMWDFNQKYLRFTSGNIPTGGDTIEVSGTPLFPIVVNVPDETSIAEYGVYEHAITEDTIRSDDEAIERALSEITAYGDSIVEGSFRTYRSGLRAGQVLNIQDTFRGINENVLIQGVDLESITPDGSRLTHLVTFATLRTMGVIQFLQRQLIDDKITEGELETLLSYLRINDSASTSDTLDPPITSTSPYTWGNFKWNFGKWS